MHRRAQAREPAGAQTLVMGSRLHPLSPPLSTHPKHCIDFSTNECGRTQRWTPTSARSDAVRTKIVGITHTLQEGVNVSRYQGIKASWFEGINASWLDCINANHLDSMDAHEGMRSNPTHSSSQLIPSHPLMSSLQSSQDCETQHSSPAVYRSLNERMHHNREAQISKKQARKMNA